jgi:hypothetical protein
MSNLETLTQEEADKLVDSFKAHYVRMVYLWNVNGLMMDGVKSDKYVLMMGGKVYVQRSEMYVKVPDEDGK